MRIIEIPVAGAHVPRRCDATPPAQHVLGAHELAVVLTDGARGRLESRVGLIARPGPLPDIAEQLSNPAGLTLHPVSRVEYRQRNQPEYIQTLQAKFNNAYLIPEGGTNALALQGVEELAHSLPQSDYVMTAVGSGGTVAGLISGLPDHTQVLGVTVLRGAEYLAQEIHELITAQRCAPWQLLHDFHHGGYAKTTPELLSFCHEMKVKYRLPLEPIYTGKLFYAIFTLAQQGYFKRGSVITAIHTGGLQGLDGLRYLTNKKSA